MTYLPPAYDPPSLEGILFAQPDDLTDEETLKQLAADRDETIAEQFRSIRSSLTNRGGHVYLPFGSPVGTLTNQPNAENFLAQNSGLVVPFSLVGFLKCRLVGVVSTASASANTPIISAKYDLQAGGFSTTVGDYSDLGSSAVTASLASATAFDTGWADLAPAAKDEEAYITVTMEGGDGAADPVLGSVGILLK